MLSLYLILLAIAGLGVLALILITSGPRKPKRKILVQPTLDNSATITFSARAAAPSVSATSSRSSLSSLGFNTLETILDHDHEPASPAQTFSASAFSANITQPALSPVATTKVEPTLTAHSSTQRQLPEIIILYLLAPPGQSFVGYELLQALLSVELRFGNMNIFHRHEYANEEGEILFSVASAVEPGTFDMVNIGGFACPGLCLFMSPTKVSDPSTTFELMLATAQQLGDDLAGQLCDEKRQLLDATTLSYYRHMLQTPEKIHAF